MMSVRPELVEGLSSLFSNAPEEREPFDKLRANDL
jgi:hypothetical protein